jgi:O-antigen/teichoic acid export membrane protein
VTRPDRSLRVRATHAAVISTALSGGQLGLRLVMLPVLSRLVEPAAFGQAASLLGMAAIAGVVAQWGLPQALIQRDALGDREFAAARTSLAYLGVAVGAMYFGVVTFWGDGLNLDVPAWIVACYACWIVSYGLGASAVARLHRDMRQAAVTSITVAAYLLGYCAIGLYLAWRGHGLVALAVAEIVSAVIFNAGAAIVAGTPISWTWDPRGWRALRSFANGQVAGRVGNQVALQADYVVVNAFVSPFGAGQYNRAYQLISVPANLSADAVSHVLFSAVSRRQNDVQRLVAPVALTHGLIAFGAVPFAGWLIASAGAVVTVVLGPRWDLVPVIAAFMAPGVYLRTTAKMLDALTRGLGAVRPRAVIQWLYAGLVVAFASVGSVHGGAVGAAVGVTVALAVSVLLLFGLAARLVPIDVLRLVRQLAESLVIGGVVFIASSLAVTATSQQVAVVELAASLLAAVTVWAVAIGIGHRIRGSAVAAVTDDLIRGGYFRSGSDGSP